MRRTKFPAVFITGRAIAESAPADRTIWPGCDTTVLYVFSTGRIQVDRVQIDQTQIGAAQIRPIKLEAAHICAAQVRMFYIVSRAGHRPKQRN